MYNSNALKFTSVHGIGVELWAALEIVAEHTKWPPFNCIDQLTFFLFINSSFNLQAAFT